VGLFIGCCGGGLPLNLLRLGEPISRGLEGGNDSVSEVPQREPGLDPPFLRGTNRAVPPRALDKVSSSSFVTTFSAVNLGRRDFFDWYSSSDAAALLTSLPRTGYIKELVRTPSFLHKKKHTRTFETFTLWETLWKSAWDNSRFDIADRDNPIPGHLITIAPRTIYRTI
jgi:hypothetical protein